MKYFSSFDFQLFENENIILSLQTIQKQVIDLGHGLLMPKKINNLAIQPGICTTSLSSHLLNDTSVVHMFDHCENNDFWNQNMLTAFSY